MNPVVISVCIMLVLALMRVNVVVALTFSAIIGGIVSGMSLNDAVSAFESGLGGGATIALSYAMLGYLCCRYFKIWHYRLTCSKCN
ncbi:hypothetical protein [Vibrio gallaecicus]|uniref:GntT/GntP/DsdX family permease n=1 Tax=Vibrio gallaecicus TaxID=552386 RepID=UPI0025B4CBD3|nr:hypothetical protein [Vibrio gallaecicus]MDN3617828.1 hypothetical protein [Vibrio gallaecicus]